MKVEFRCWACGGPAATVEIAAGDELRVESFLGRLSVPGGATPAVRAAASAGDAAALRAADPAAFGFVCPDCRACYCGRHWVKQAQFDPDFPGWYDCTYGTCPAGHRHLLDD